MADTDCTQPVATAEINGDDNEAHPESAPWHVLHVRPRCEKKMADYCESSGINHYLPLRAERKIYQRRRVEFKKPLFAGYVFAQFGPTLRATALKSGQIVRIIEAPDQARLLDELDQVRKALDANPVLAACPAITQGTRVRITSGPFMGLDGIVSTIKGQTRVMLNVDIIGQAVPVEAGMEMLERL